MKDVIEYIGVNRQNSVIHAPPRYLQANEVRLKVTRNYKSISSSITSFKKSIEPKDIFTWLQQKLDEGRKAGIREAIEICEEYLDKGKEVMYGDEVFYWQGCINKLKQKLGGSDE